jgi:hypothetical protein
MATLYSDWAAGPEGVDTRLWPREGGMRKSGASGSSRRWRRYLELSRTDLPPAFGTPGLLGP